MSSQTVSHARGNRKTIIVGFDFGTHSTKVVVRERGKADGRIVQFDDSAREYPSMASPSLVRCVEDRLFFGTRALTTSGGRLFKSLKVRLLPQVRSCEISLPHGMTDRLLVASYFAWAFQQLRQGLDRDGDANVFLNVAAPMSHFENMELKTRYLQIIQAGWSASFAGEVLPINQGISCFDAKRTLEPALEGPVLGTEQRRFEVLPETIAPIVSLSLDPWMTPGMYMIIDTGAATTEMSVFHAGDSGADQTVLCYQDETMLLGGNDLNMAAQREPVAHRAALNAIMTRMDKQYRRIWQLGYDFDKDRHVARKRWKELTLVLSGGGTRHTAVADRLTTTNPMFPWPAHESRLKVCRHVPGTLELDYTLYDDDGSMYAVANGLAIERKHWPIIFQPDQIEPLTATEEVEDKPLGYWYLDAK